MNNAWTFEPLSWDSALFGYSVVRVRFQSCPSAKDVCVVRDSAKNAGCRLVYLVWPGNNPFSEPQSVGLSHCGVKAEFLQNVGSDTRILFPESVVRCDKVNPAIRSLALESGRHSRFFLDRGFRNNEFSALYERWIDKAFAPDGDRCFAFGRENDPDGILTLEREGEGRTLRIGLHSVHERARRTGVGSALVAVAIATASAEGAIRLAVATQSENLPACLFYEKNGFTLLSETTIAHLWIDP